MVDAMLYGQCELAEKICEAVGISAENAKRIIVDIPCDDWVKVYVEMCGTSKLLDVNWTSLSGAEIKILDKE